MRYGPGDQMDAVIIIKRPVCSEIRERRTLTLLLRLRRDGEGGTGGGNCALFMGSGE